MNLVEKAEKALEYIKNNESSTKIHELQAAVGTLGKCLAALGSRQTYARHYANLLQCAIPVLLSLASHDSAEMRLAGDEALNRTVVGGLPFHCYKTNITLQNNVDPGKNARWNRAIFNRICLGETWLRPGMGRIRIQAQTLVPKLSIIVRHTEEIQLIVEALESNLPRILNCLADYTSDEEIMELCTALYNRAKSSEAAVRRAVSQCVGHVCAHRLTVFTHILDTMYDKLWPHCTDNNTALGWFSIIKAVLQINDVKKLDENNLFTVRNYMELYNLFMVYLEKSTIEHNIQNSVMECLSVLLSQSNGVYKQVLLDKHPLSVDLGNRHVHVHSNRVSRVWSDINPSDDDSDRSIAPTPALSCDDVSIRTPESPISDYEVPPTVEEVTQALERLSEFENDYRVEQDADVLDEIGDTSVVDGGDYKEQVDIGSLTDDDVPLKYCARLLVSKFLFSGNTGALVSDRSIRVSVKCQALSCLAEIVSLYPKAALLCIDVQHEHNTADGQNPSSNDDVLTRNLDMKFDHFSDANKEKPQTSVSNSSQPTPSPISTDSPSILYLISTKAVSHCDPLLQGRARAVIGRYMTVVLMEGVTWSDGNVLRTLVGCLVEGAQIPSPTCSVPSLQTLSNVLQALICSQTDNTLVSTVLSELSAVETDPYWLVRVTLCTLYENIDYFRLFLVLPEYSIRSRLIMDTLYRLLADDDQRVRAAASKAIANIVPTIYPSKLESKHSILNKLANQETDKYVINASTPSLDLMRNLHFFKDLPEQILYGNKLENIDGLRTVVGEIMMFLMESSCKSFSFGLIECLHNICKMWSPWVHQDAYIDQGILDFMVGKLQFTYLPVGQRSLVNNICAMVYPVEIHGVLESVHQSESLPLPRLPFVASLHGVVLKSLNVVSHVVEDLGLPGTPTTHLPGTPVRRPHNESRRTDDEKPRRRAQFVGNFYSDAIYVSLYDDLKATYSNYKVNLDQKSSIFFNFTQSVLNCLSIQLELCTEKEMGPLTEEILHYLRVIMTHCPNKSVFCVKQLLKCLFSTNIINHYKDYISIAPSYKNTDKHTIDFFRDILQVNNINETPILTEQNVRNSGQKLSLSTKNPKLAEERKLLQDMENYSRNKIDKNWSTNKKELTRYIRMFEPAVIQALKSYTMQHDIPLQCTVLALLEQLLSLRVNYCMLDSDQVFIGYVMKQLDLIEHHEIPDCDPLVTSILLFLLQLCSSKHHTKQIIELPKIIHVCECVVAGGCGSSCSGLGPLGLGVFLSPLSALAHHLRQEAMATREVTFNMLQKNMNHPRVIEAVTCVLAISQQHPEMYYRWSELACDTLLNLMMHDSIEYACKQDVHAVERLIESIYRDVMLEQSRVEAALRILLKAAPDENASPIRRLRYLTNILLAAAKIFPLIPEREIFMIIESVMVGTTSLASCFSSGGSWDPLFAEAVPLRAPVLLARVLLKGMATSILLLNDTDMELAKVIAVNFVITVKHIFHNDESSLFQTLASTAQSIIHDDLNNVNTDSNPNESIPMDQLHSICLSKRHQIPLLTIHWAHLLTRLNIFHNRFWIDLSGFNLNEENNQSMRQTNPDMVQVGSLLAFCYQSSDSLRKQRAFICAPGGSTLFGYSPPLLDSLIADRASTKNILNASMENMNFIQGELSLQVLRALSSMSEDVNEALILFICRLLDYLEPAMSKRFANLAVSKCQELSNCSDFGEDIQKAYDYFVQKELYRVYPVLFRSLRRLLPNSEDIQINEPSIGEQNEEQCVLKYVQYRCSTSTIRKHLDSEYDLALYLTQSPKETIISIINNKNFDIKLLNQIYRVIMKKYITAFTKIIYEFDKSETEKDNQRKERDIKPKLENQIESNKITMSGLHVFKRSDSKDKEHHKSQFFIPISERSIEEKNKEFQDTDIEHPNVPESWLLATNKLESFIQDFISKNLSIKHRNNFESILKTIDGLLSSLNKLIKFTSTVPVVTSKCLKDFLPQNLAKILSNFIVVALQFVSQIVSEEGYSGVLIDLVLRVVSKSLQLNQVWCCLNEDDCEGQRQIAITSLYHILMVLLKNTKPLKLQEYLKTEGDKPNSDYVNLCNKLVTMIQFIENNSYRNKVVNSRLLTKCHNERLKQIVFCIGRLKSVWSVCMFPPCLWSTVSPTSDESYKSIFLPLDELKDSSVLEQYLFRVCSVRWSSRGEFEQTWVCTVGGGGGSAAPAALLTPLPHPHTHSHQPNTPSPTTLTHVLIDLPDHSYHVPYYVDVTGISKAPDWRTRMFVRYVQDYIQVDLDSCVQLLLDLIAQAIEEQRDIPTYIRCLLWSFPAVRSISHLTTISSLLPLSSPIPSLILLKTLCDVILAPQAVQGASLRDLSSTWAPTRIAALKSNLLLLENGRLNGEMTVAVKEHVLGVVNKQYGSLLEEELSWRFLLKLIESGDVDIVNTAIQYVTMNPHHYCTGTILKGINTLIQHNVLSKELKYTIIERLMESIDKFNENDSLRILILFMFSAVSEHSYFSSSLTPDADIDPELVIRGISGIESGTKMLKSSFTIRTLTGEALLTLVSNSLPPPAVLSRIMNLLSIPDKSYISITCYILSGLIKRAKNTDSLSAVLEWCLTTANLLPKGLLLGVLALLCATSSNLNHLEDTVPLCIDLIRRSLTSDPDSVNEFEFKKLSVIEIEFLNMIVCESGLDRQHLEIIRQLCVDNQYLQGLYKRMCDILG